MYRPDNNFGKEQAPEFSLGSRYPSIMDNTGNNPGPGDYENPEQLPSSQLKSKKSKFGSQKRFSEPQLTKAGVGDYNISKSLISPKGKFPQDDRFHEKKNLPPARNI